MKTLALLLALTLSSHAVPIPMTTSIAVVDNDVTGSPVAGYPFSQTLVFDVVWGDIPQSPATLIPGPGFVTAIQVADLVHSVFIIIVGTPRNGIRLETHVGPLAFGADRSLDNLDTSIFPRVFLSPMMPCVQTIDIEPIPGEPLGARFTFTAENNVAFLPDTAATTPLLLLALGLLALAHRKCVARN